MTTSAPAGRPPALKGQTVVVLGGTMGMGLETARLAKAEGADVIVVARDRERLEHVGKELGARTTALDVTDFAGVEAFFAGLPGTVDHVLLTGPGPYYAPLAEFDFDKARHDIETHLLLPILVARTAAKSVRPGGTLLFMSGTGARRPGPGLALTTALTSAMPALVRNLALEIAPVRVNLLAPGFVDTPLSASLLGDGLEARRKRLRENLPIRRVVGPEDVAALAIHVMANTALTGATFDVDGGQQLVER